MLALLVALVAGQCPRPGHPVELSILRGEPEQGLIRGMTDSDTHPPSPEEVAEVLALGVLQQALARQPALAAALARVAPPGAPPVGEDCIRAEAIAAGMATCLLRLDHRLSPEDLARLHQRVEDNFESMEPDFALVLWLYYLHLEPMSWDERIRRLARMFWQRCYDTDTEPPDDLDPEPLAALLVPKGSAPMAIEIGRLLRRSAGDEGIV